MEHTDVESCSPLARIELDCFGDSLEEKHYHFVGDHKRNKVMQENMLIVKGFFIYFCQ